MNVEEIGVGYKSIEHIDIDLNKDFDKYMPLISAFLNGDGGVIVVNVGKDGTADLIREIERALASRVQPSSPIYVTPQILNGTPTVVIEVPSGREPPYAYKNVIFDLQGGQCKPASMGVVREWIIKGRGGLERWENRICAVDPNEVVDTMELDYSIGDAQRRGMINEEVLIDNIFNSLSEFGAIRQGRFVNAGVVMFAKRPARIAPQTLIRLTHYAGCRADSEIITAKQFEGPICKTIDLVIEYVATHSPRIVKFNEKTGLREESCPYPTLAVREALVNACAHRDYESIFGGVVLSFFSNRLEIWNSGRFPDGVSIKSLNEGKGAASILINPTICNFLYIRGYMERIGRGCAYIAKASKDVGTKVEWSIEKGRGVGIKFMAGHLMTGVSGSRKVQSLSPSINVDGDLVEIQEYLISNSEAGTLYKILSENPGVRRPTLMMMTGWTRGVLQGWLDKLKHAKLIEFSGSKKTGGFVALPLVASG